MPASPPLLLGLDVGTTGCKCLAVGADGVVLASATHEYPLHTPRPGWSEQNPEDWWRAACAALREVLGALAGSGGGPRIAAVGLTGQMHGATLLDAQGEVLRPAILWNDQRTADQCGEITRRVGAERVIRLTGNPVLTGFTAPKLLWVEQHEPEVHARIATVLLPKDYVRYRLSGARFSDVADASGTALFDVAGRRWSDEMLAAVGVPRAWLPDVFESPEVCARVSRDGAAQSGLAEGTSIVAGAGDQAAQAVGAGIVAEGLVSCTIGTSGVVFAASDRYRVEPEGRLHAFCHAVPGKWHLMGVMLSAGGSLRWLRDTLGEPEVSAARARGADPYELLLERAAAASPGCEGLTFLPYLTGERTPHNDPQARACFAGLTLRHGRAEIVRSVVEGVTFGLRDGLELMRGLGIAPREIRASGGGARSPFWRQMLADVFDSPIACVNVTDGAAYGAALLAGVGAGVWAGVPAACAAAVRVVSSQRPVAEAVAAYRAAYARFRSLYPRLRGPAASA